MFQFHLPSLLVANTSVITLCGLLLLFTWLRGREQRLLLWAGIMLLLASAGLILNALRGMGMDWLPIIIGNMLLLLCGAMNWTAMRLFCGRSPRYAWVLAGALLWLAACFWPAIYDSLQARVQVNAVLIGAYLLAALLELWRARSQLDVSPTPAMILIGLHLIFITLRALLSPGESAVALQNSPLFGYLLIESLLYAVGMAFVILSMVKERAEQGLRLAAYRDVLTGVANRRGFLESGERLLALCRRQQRPLALLLFDLDHFKRINDGFGHAAGDQVLVDFATLVQGQMRKEDIFARIGGEEFACLIVADRQQAMTMAERIRADFFTLESNGLTRSVSIGVSFCADAECDLQWLLAQADQALYSAKHQGRNRVQCLPIGDWLPAEPAR
ncbi:diguanylate cyclase [Pseudomonas sp. NCHU5208]|uniref:GGDEF domain-containing protein n=1 Tax=unclassified Pseudomonas TaxID=196821 RepID=UPI003F9581BA